ncbi:MAG: DUF1294 domain-containing protein [Lachnospiraceae bacterium]|nr:DUF1294 domain-containing protein [Lachnospiraceae bacterium]
MKEPVSTGFFILTKNTFITADKGSSDGLRVCLKDRKERIKVNVKIIIFYLLVINLISFLMYGMDKKKARKKEYRIPEKTLLLVGAIGGSIGAMAGMKVFHHKTKHKKFVLGIPLMFVFQCFVLWWLWKSMA